MYMIILAAIGLALSSLANLAPESVSPDNAQILDLSELGLWFLMMAASFHALVWRRRSSVFEQKLGEQNAETIGLNQKLVRAEAESERMQQELTAQQSELAAKSIAADSKQEELQDLRDKLAKTQERLRKSEEAIANASQSKNHDEDILQLLSILQSQGRFLDFVMGDVSQVPDERMGAAARIVHQGCSKAIKEYFDIKPVVSDNEGAEIEINESESQQKFRIVGSGQDEFPLRGRLLHRGWRTQKVDLPKRLGGVRDTEQDSGIITPAEVEVSR